MDTAVEATRPKSALSVGDKLALTIQVCAAHNISLAYFYVLRQRGEGLREMRVGRRVLISIEEARAWREAQQQKFKNRKPGHRHERSRAFLLQPSPRRQARIANAE